MTSSKNIVFESIDYIIVGFAALLMILSWVYAGIEYSSLHDTIPSHFNLKGDVDGHGNKNILWFISGIFTILFISSFFLAKAKHLHNLQLRSRIANFRSVTILMPLIGFIQGIAVYSIVKSSTGNFEYPGWILPSILMVTAATIILMIIIIVKNK